MKIQILMLSTICAFQVDAATLRLPSCDIWFNSYAGDYSVVVGGRRDLTGILHEVVEKYNEFVTDGRCIKRPEQACTVESHKSDKSGKSGKYSFLNREYRLKVGSLKFSRWYYGDWIIPYKIKYLTEKGICSKSTPSDDSANHVSDRGRRAKEYPSYPKPGEGWGQKTNRTTKQ